MIDLSYINGALSVYAGLNCSSDVIFDFSLEIDDIHFPFPKLGRAELTAVVPWEVPVIRFICTSDVRVKCTTLG